ncbi:hypothetical protein C1Y40_00650 [Mycobacterium talmoniae]|uniref:Uncharacterized protein n=1 Tax=Mycobacterium talmoniae TaxID=1858794 RepID=A0A2S8BR29_9MYCO|nr:hypothetical protein C1Y40_00650 [Mycobacterium talmoniae]
MQHRGGRRRCAAALGAHRPDRHRHREIRGGVDGAQRLAVITPVAVVGAGAAAEVRIGARGDVAIPFGQGVGQPVRIDPGLGAQLGEVGGHRKPVRHRLAGRHPQKSVPLQVQRVEHDPRRIVDVAVAGIQVVERAGHRVVVARLVDEPPPGAVDDDAARAGAFQPHTAAALLAVDGVAGDLHDRHPPRFAHSGQVGAAGHRHPQPVTGVVGRRYRAVHRAAQERLGQRRIPFEAAVGQDHPAARVHPRHRAVALDPDAGHRALGGDEFDGAAAGLRHHPRLEQALQQAGDQRGAGHAELAGAVVDVGVQPGPGLGVEPDIGPVRGKRGDPLGPLTEPAQRVGHRTVRAAAAGLSAGQLRLVVGKTGGDLEPQTAVCLNEVQHRLPGAHERVDQRVVHRAERLRPQIGQRVVHAERGVRGAVVRGDPGDAPGDRGGAADGRGPLVERDRGAVRGGRQGRGEAGTAAAADDDIDFVVPRRHRLGPLCDRDAQLRIADNCLAACRTASLPRRTTSSRCEIRLMQVGGDGGTRCTGTARP